MPNIHSQSIVSGNSQSVVVGIITLYFSMCSGDPNITPPTALNKRSPGSVPKDSYITFK